MRKKELNEKEKYWIEKLNSFYPKNKNGLNLTLGGRGSLGAILSDVSRKKISKAHSIPVFQYSITGDFIKKFSSAKDAQEKTGISLSEICACCTGIRNKKTAGGFFWTRQKRNFFVKKINRSKYRMVVKIDNENIFYYDNIKDAALKNKIDATNISRCCNGQRISAGGYIWKFYDEYDHGTKDKFNQKTR